MRGRADAVSRSRQPAPAAIRQGRLKAGVIDRVGHQVRCAG